MREEAVIEWAPFRLKAGVPDEALFEASETLQADFIDRQPGFVQRELLKGSDREWVDLVWWESREAADRAVANAAASAACHAYFQLMEEADHAAPGAGVLHFARRKAYPGGGA